MDTIENKTAATILQQPTEIELGGKTYKVAPPSIATLILISKEIATLPQVKLAGADIINETLAIAKDCTAIGRIAATMILGAKRAGMTKTREVEKTQTHKFLFFTFRRKYVTEEKYSELDELARQLMEDTTPRELQEGIAKILMQMQVGDFFALTTFLLEINMTRQTKVDEQTASGQ